MPTDGRKVDAAGHATAAGSHVAWPSAHRMDQPTAEIWAFGEPNGGAAEMCVNAVRVQPSGLNDMPCDSLAAQVLCECLL